MVLRKGFAKVYVNTVNKDVNIVEKEGKHRR